nr:helix-hairpin-helix domain-containing protein [Halanaerobacter jeridensis]
MLTDDRVVIKYSAAKIVSESGKVNLNSIPQQDLGKLPGVGSILSARINKKRLEDSFLAQQELKTIKGIGAEKYRELKPLVTVNNQGKININTASRKVLKTMNGIAAITAANIVSYRQDNGAFSTTEALKNVSGIGDTTYQELAQKITVQSELFTVVFKISIPKRKMQEKITELVQVEVD